MESPTHQSPTRPLKAGVWVGIPAAILALGCVLFWSGKLDLAVSGAFHSAEHGWQARDFPLFRLLYDFGVHPALWCAGIALLALFAGLIWKGARRWRKLAAYYVLVVALGPGLLVNAVLKEHWGRPRPRDVTEFGGVEKFEHILEYDPVSPGKSFPSGHASMGFVLFALFFVGRALRVKGAGWMIVTAMILGGFLGLARVAQGGHFASDVMWSAAICYFVALGLYRMMGLSHRPFFEEGKMPLWLKIVTLMSCLAGGLLAVAAPYEQRFDFTAPPQIASDMKMEFRRADLVIAGGEQTSFKSHAEAFGSLGARLDKRFQKDLVNGIWKARLKETKSGFFASIEQPATLMLAAESEGQLDVRVERGSVRATLVEGAWDWDIEVGEGDVTLRVPAKLQVKISRERVTGEVINNVPGLDWSAEKGRWKRGAEPTIRVRVAVDGDLLLEAVPQ